MAKKVNKESSKVDKDKSVEPSESPDKGIEKTIEKTDNTWELFNFLVMSLSFAGTVFKSQQLLLSSCLLSAIFMYSKRDFMSQPFSVKFSLIMPFIFLFIGMMYPPIEE